MVKEKCLEHGIDLGMDISKDLEGLEITADKRKLKQIMFNLLSNAVNFTPNGGKIKVMDKKEDEGLLTRVLDTGIGIAPGAQEKIFVEFYQVKGGIRDHY